MTTKNKTYTLLLIALLSTGAVIGGIYWTISSEKRSIAYVDNMRLFNEFALKKELEKDLNRLENTSKSQLDSMRIQIELLARKIETEKTSRETQERFEFTRQQYLAKEEQLRLNNENSAKRFNEQIWNQLNAYVKEFAKNNNYQIVLGTSGDGNIMYAAEELDVTEKAIAYVNQKYKGKS